MLVLLALLIGIVIIVIIHTLLYTLFSRKLQPIFSELPRPLMLTHQGGELLLSKMELEILSYKIRSLAKNTAQGFLARLW